VRYQPGRAAFAVDLAAIAVITALFFATTWRGWIPWDAGMLAQAADRVLYGERPHVDFADPYPGLLTWVHAAAFAIGGESLATLRWVLLPTAVAAQLTIYWLLRRMWPAAIAAGFLIGMAPWSIPMYPESMASWYAVFFSIFALAALEKARMTSGTATGWWMLAGCCVAVAALMKTTGLATLLALGLLLVWRNQSWSRRLVGLRSSWPMRIVVTGGLVLAGLAATRLVARLPGNVTLLYFCGPLWSLVAAGVVREFREARGGLAERLPPFVREAGPIAAGFAIVVAGYLALAHPDAASLRAFYEGVFVLPFSRLKDLVLGFDIAWYMLPAVLAGVSLVVALTCRLPEQAAVPASVFLAVIPWVFLGGSYTHPLTRESAYWIIRFALPAVAIGGAWIASLREDRGDGDRERAWLFMAAGAACMLMQYPFPAIHYAAYILPCWGLAAAALLRLAGQGNTLTGVVISWFLACGAASLVWIVSAADPYATATGMPRRTLAAWERPRARLIVPAAEVRKYERLLEAIAQVAPAGSTLFVYPDSPEVNFLSQTKNPTPAIYHSILPKFDPLDPRYMEDESIAAVVLVDDAFSIIKIPPATRLTIQKHFPHVIDAGNGYLIYSRRPPAGGREDSMSPRAGDRAGN
jgi:hypothetical protein